ncbi:MAG TPA: hypothetical protein VJB99_00830 [Patescibacteria group bacterium]|nr:hypothetical protein [Patescibacteria group bacterium]
MRSFRKLESALEAVKGRGQKALKAVKRARRWTRQELGRLVEAAAMCSMATDEVPPPVNNRRREPVIRPRPF